MDRSKMISQLEDPSEVFDFLVIGGGATVSLWMLRQEDIESPYSNNRTLRKELPAVVRSWSMAVSVIWRKEMSPWFWKLCANEACYARTLPIW